MVQELINHWEKQPDCKECFLFSKDKKITLNNKSKCKKKDLTTENLQKIFYETTSSFNKSKFNNKVQDAEELDLFARSVIGMKEECGKKCNNCSFRGVQEISKQTRGTDEPPTIFYLCPKCKFMERSSK